MPRTSHAVILLALIGLGACSRDVRLIGVETEIEASHIVEALRVNAPTDPTRARQATSAHIVVASGRDGGFEVRLDSAELDRARAIMRALDLPRPPRDGFDLLDGGGGLVGDRDLERALLVHAQAQEMERTLEKLDRVRFARVHLVVPEVDPYALSGDEPSREPRASVLLVYDGAAAGNGLAISVAPITDDGGMAVDATAPAELDAAARELVVRGVEGLAPSDVTIVLSPFRPDNFSLPPEVAARLPEVAGAQAETLQALNKILYVAVTALAVALLAIGAWVFMHRRTLIEGTTIQRKQALNRILNGTIAAVSSAILVFGLAVLALRDYLVQGAPAERLQSLNAVLYGFVIALGLLCLGMGLSMLRSREASE